jgi:hypothetical protein
VRNVRCLSDSAWGRALIRLGVRNLGADRVLVHIARGGTGAPAGAAPETETGG